MSRSLDLRGLDNGRSAARVTEFIVGSVNNARVVCAPFYHLEFDHVFPDDIYHAMLAMMPATSDYRPMSGRAKGNDAPDGTHTRVKIDLFPELVRHLPIEKRTVWESVGRALRSDAVKAALVHRLAPALEQRFGRGFAGVGMYPIPVLTRDFPGYRINPHTDTHWKGMTVQLYLPPDTSVTQIGTIFYERLSDGCLRKSTQMKFAPNTGYAFAVGEDAWHSVDPVGAEVTTRDSILLTYFIDSGPLRLVRNRAKRIGNFFRSEISVLSRSPAI
jgi:hypothetical protein